MVAEGVKDPDSLKFAAPQADANLIKSASIRSDDGLRPRKLAVQVIVHVAQALMIALAAGPVLCVAAMAFSMEEQRERDAAAAAAAAAAEAAAALSSRTFTKAEQNSMRNAACGRGVSARLQRPHLSLVKPTFTCLLMSLGF